ncbi:hypothetical protein QL285_071891 [Trifolium repens]|nr:hypothetical protein QL285_071891 [Trifolium repens]
MAYSNPTPPYYPYPPQPTPNPSFPSYPHHPHHPSYHSTPYYPYSKNTTTVSTPSPYSTNTPIITQSPSLCFNRGYTAPTPTPSSSPNPYISLPTPQTLPPSKLEMKLSIFDGSEDAYWWIICSEKSFNSRNQRLSDTEKVLESALAMRGCALTWWISWFPTHPMPSWDSFTCALLWHFKPEWRPILPIEGEEEEEPTEKEQTEEEPIATIILQETSPKNVISEKFAESPLKSELPEKQVQPEEFISQKLLSCQEKPEEDMEAIVVLESHKKFNFELTNTCNVQLPATSPPLLPPVPPSQSSENVLSPPALPPPKPPDTKLLPDEVVTPFSPPPKPPEKVLTFVFKATTITQVLAPPLPFPPPPPKPPDRRLMTIYSPPRRISVPLPPSPPRPPPKPKYRSSTDLKFLSPAVVLSAFQLRFKTKNISYNILLLLNSRRPNKSQPLDWCVVILGKSHPLTISTIRVNSYTPPKCRHVYSNFKIQETYSHVINKPFVHESLLFSAMCPELCLILTARRWWSQAHIWYYHCSVHTIVQFVIVDAKMCPLNHLMQSLNLVRHHQHLATPTWLVFFYKSIARFHSKQTFGIQLWVLNAMGQIFCYGQFFCGPTIDVPQVSQQHHLVGPPYTRPARKPPDLYLNLEDKVQVNPAAMIEDYMVVN